MALTGKWLIVPGLEDKVEFLNQNGVPAVWMQIIQPTPVSGVAFPEEQREQTLRLLELPTDGYHEIATEVDNLFLMIPQRKRDARNATQEAYINLCRLRLVQEVEQSEDKLRNLEEQIQSHLQQIAELSRAAAIERHKLAHFQSYTRKHEQEWAAEFESLLEHPDVKGIEVFDGGLRIFTNTIYITHGRKRYRIGDFRIDIYITGKLQIYNIRNAGRNNSYAHPHIRNGGIGCVQIGGRNLGAVLAQLIGEFEFATAAFTIIEVLKSYNPNDCIRAITNWEEVS